MFDAKTLTGAEGCTDFRTYVFHRIETTHPLTTVVVDYEYTTHINDDGVPYSQRMYEAALTRTVATINAAGSRPVFLSPPPPQFSDPVTCLSLHVSSFQQCAVPTICLNSLNATSPRCHFMTNPTLSIGHVLGLSTAIRRGGGTFVSLQRLFCTSSTCPPVIGNTVVFMDQLHVSLHSAELVEPALAQLIPSLDL
jgi:hypothetical protein